jgi:hypothetical protein
VQKNSSRLSCDFFAISSIDPFPARLELSQVTEHLLIAFCLQAAHEGELEARHSLAILEEESAVVTHELQTTKTDMEEVCKVRTVRGPTPVRSHSADNLYFSVLQELYRTHKEAEEALAKADLERDRLQKEIDTNSREARSEQERLQLEMASAAREAQLEQDRLKREIENVTQEKKDTTRGREDLVRLNEELLQRCEESEAQLYR